MSPARPPVRRSLRALSVAIGTSFRADRWRSWALFVCFSASSLTTVASAWWLKVIVNAAVRVDTTSALYGAAGLGLTAGLGMVLGAAGVRQMLPLAERTGHWVDQRLVDMTAGIAGIEAHERSDYQDELELLRSQRRVLASAANIAATALAIAVQAVVTAILLARVAPLLLAIPVFAIPSLAAGRRAEKIRQAALDETVEDVRRSRHLFEVATSAPAGKELRIFGLGTELMSRHRLM